MSKRPLMMRSFAQRDFESNTGMGLDEWAEFSERLLNRFRNITTALQQVEDTLKESKFGEVRESIKRLGEASAPFLERFDLVTEALDRFANYMFEMPKRMESMPVIFKRFISEEDRRMASEAPKLGEQIKSLNESLATTRKLITDIMERCR